MHKILLVLLFTSLPAFAAKRFTHIDQFTSDNVNFAGKSATGTAAAGETVNIDYTLTFNACMTGATLIVKGGKQNDKVTLQVVHPLYGVVNEFITDWAVAEDQNTQFTMSIDYPANLPAGLTLRTVYKAQAGLIGSREVSINYFLHKVME